MNGSLGGSLGVSCLVGVALVAGANRGPDMTSVARGGAATPTHARATAPGDAALDDAKLWPVSSGAVSVHYRFDEDISDKAAAIWNLNMKRWEKLTRDRVRFSPVTSSNPVGPWVQFKSSHAKIGQCGVGAGTPTNCKVRDSAILGIGMRSGTTTTIFADLALSPGTKDDLQNVKTFYYVDVVPPNQPGTTAPLQIASLDVLSDGNLILWYEPDTVISSYQLWRSKGTITDLTSAAALTAVSLPAGLDTVFTSTHRGSTLRGAAVKADVVYTWWNVGNELKVARGSSTDLDSTGPLQTVALPAGETIADLIDMSFDADGSLNTWFVKGYDAYGPGVLVPRGYRRYVGTYRDLDGANNAPGVTGETLSGSNTTAALHELGHALGFIHEHQRVDRDSYVWVDPAGNDHDYGNKIGSAVNHSAFDFASIMLYKNGSIGRLDARHTPIPWRVALSWHDVAGLAEAYGLAPYSVADAWAASADSDLPLNFSPLAGMADADIIGGDFSQDGVFYAWYSFDGNLKRSWGHEWDLDAKGSGNFSYPLQIDGAFAGVIGIAIQHDDNGHVYTWYKRTVSAQCPSGVYRGTGTSANLGEYVAPACVTVFDSAHGGSHIVDFAIDNYSGSDRVYTLYDDGKISVGSSTNLASIRPPADYKLPENVAASQVYSFALLNGVAIFHAHGYRVLRDPAFKNKF